jgi:SPOR domain
MADNDLRTSRRDPLARDSESDPLAELARLIGQSDPRGGRGRGAGESAQHYDDAAPTTQLDWAAAEEYVQRSHDSADGYASSRAANEESFLPHPGDNGSWRFDRGEQQSGAFDDARADLDRFGGSHDDPASRAPSLAYVSPLQAGDPSDEEGEHGRQASSHSSGDDAQDEYYDEEPRSSRRRATIIVVAVLGVLVVGTAGALGYRAMFGGSLIPSLPPIIKPGNTPVKIVPSHEAQAGAPNADAKGTGDQLVTHEEKPVDVQSANPPPRVVTTIPVISNGAGMPSPNSPPPPPAASPPTTAAPVVPSTPSGSTQPNQQPMGAMGQMTSPMPPPSGSKPVHTVTIRPDQPTNVAPPHAAPTPPAHSATARQPATKPAREAVPRTAAGGPLSIVPNQEAAAPRPEPPREHTAMARSSEPMSLTARPAEPSRPAVEAAPARSGGYAVQVSSQRSEADAMASFRSLQAKYPQQLGQRRAMIRRADLGAKGVYYRALVGPFASAEQAASLCSSLKTAGGTCLIQRN